MILLNCTYLTNRFKKPMLHIGAVTPDNLTILEGVYFLRYERRVDYVWAMEKFGQIFSENYDAFLEVFVTDRSLALIGSFKEHFPESKHVLCFWHVNQNVQANTRFFF